MLKYLFICFALFFSTNSKSQNFDLAEAEKSLVLLRLNCLQEENDSLKLILNQSFNEQLIKVLSSKNSLNYSFDSLKSIAILTASDGSFRIYNWEISFANNSKSYFGIVQSLNKKKQQVQLTTLLDKSTQLKKPENSILDAENWYGAHYYKLIETKHKKKSYYTLLGANWSNMLVRKKIIDVIRIGSDGKVKFGEALFQNNKITQKRVLFNYSSEISMSLRYDENKKMILFDHLVPRESNLKGQFEFYGPDLSIDGYLFVKGKWVLKEDIDARNQKNR
jgi:hypothetical protein